MRLKVVKDWLKVDRGDRFALDIRGRPLNPRDNFQRSARRLPRVVHAVAKPGDELSQVRRRLEMAAFGLAADLAITVTARK